MVKKWVPTFDWHDMELVTVEMSDLKFMQGVQRDLNTSNRRKQTKKQHTSFCCSTDINDPQSQIFTTNILMRPDITKSIRHPRFKYPQALNEDLTYAQLDAVLHVLGECYPPETWNFGSEETI